MVKPQITVHNDANSMIGKKRAQKSSSLCILVIIFLLNPERVGPEGTVEGGGGAEGYQRGWGGFLNGQSSIPEKQQLCYY